MSHTDYQRKRRAAARAKGLCTSCATKRPEPGFTSCTSCRQRYLDRHKEKKPRAHRPPPLPWCEECLVFGPHRPGCAVTGTAPSFRRVA